MAQHQIGQIAAAQEQVPAKRVNASAMKAGRHQHGGVPDWLATVLVWIFVLFVLPALTPFLFALTQITR